MMKTFRIAALNYFLAASGGAGVLESQVPGAADAMRLVAPIENTFTGLPGGGSWCATAAPLMGNGDIGVCLLGKPESLAFMLGKNDFWRLKLADGETSALNFGQLRLSIPGLAGAASAYTQRLADATTTGRLTLKDGTGVEITTYVAAAANVLVIELTCQGKPVEVSAELVAAKYRFKDEVTAGTGQGITWLTRGFSQDVDTVTGASAALKVVGASGPVFTLPPGRMVMLLVAMCSNFETKDHLARAKQLASAADATKLLAAHQAWWAGYWRKSFVEIGDPEIMRRYYTAQYVMGAASRNPEFPPGIIGPWITSGDKIFAWGAYWMNYNHVAPFYGLYSSNHLEQADPQDTPMLQFMERGREYARDILHTRGLLYPVGLGPLGIDINYMTKVYQVPNVEGGKVLTWGQRSNTAYNLVNMAQRWYLTYDPAYGKKIYPYVLGVVDFWEDYLTPEDDGKGGKRYVINNESVHEGSGANKNPVSTLGLVRNAFRLALDMSTELGLDAPRRARWQEILDKLSAYPTQQHNGKTIFILSEKGPVMWGSNTVHIQHIYPAGQIGLDSDPQLLEIARNALDAYPRWHDGNGSNSFFPVAARIGYKPEVILNELRRYGMGPNGFIQGNPHGIENCSTVPNTLNEMLLQSHEGMLRLFPVWPKNRDARFGTLRARGAFLVSAELKNGVVTGVKIVSEKGRDCTVQNPWPNQKVALTNRETLAGERLTIKTKPGETIELAPET